MWKLTDGSTSQRDAYCKLMGSFFPTALPHVNIAQILRKMYISIEYLHYASDFKWRNADCI